MKQLICLVVLLLGFMACESVDRENITPDDVVPKDIEQRKAWTKHGLDTLEVSSFVSKLKDGTYEFRDIAQTGEIFWMIMPTFGKEDIPQLLLYAGDTTHIKEFPINPISSRFPYHIEDGSFILGECLLWTIDGIRCGRPFPSLDPVLVTKEGVEHRYLNGEKLLEVVKLYKSWWEKVKGSDKLIEEVDPLEGTAWQWS